MSWHRCDNPKHDVLETQNEQLRQAVRGLLRDLADTGTGLALDHPAWRLLRDDPEDSHGAVQGLR